MTPTTSTPADASAPSEPPRLIALDLDGTVLTSSGEVTPRTVTALRDAAAAGWHVVIATGRPPHLVTRFGDELGAAAFAVTVNGGMVVDLRSGETLHSSLFPADQARDVARELRRTDAEFGFALATEAGFAHEPGFSERLPVPPSIPTTVDATGVAGDQAIKLLAFHHTHSAEELLERLDGVLARLGHDNLAVSHLGADAVEIGPANVDKSTGLSWLCDRLGVEQRHVVAVGDELNDAEMLRWAASGVAVSNASPAVIEIADHMIPTNDDEGVARLLEALVDGQVRLLGS